MSFFSKFLSSNKQAFHDHVTGIDISDQTVELVDLVNSKKFGLRGLGSGKINLEPGTVVRGRIMDAAKLQIAVRKAFNEAVPKPIVPEHVVFGLPESQTYTHTFNIKREDSNKLDFLIKKEAQSYIPLEHSEMVIAHRILYEDRKNIEILIAVTSSDVIEEWQLFFESLDIKVDLFDIEQLATFRGMFNKPLDAPVCVIDIGSVTSHISIFDLHGLRYAYSMKVSGETLTEELSKGLSKSLEEAEAIKREMGLSGSDKKVSEILRKTLRPIFSDTKRTFEYFEKKMGTKIEKLVLVGGSSALPGLVEFVNSEFDIKTELGQQVILPDNVSSLYIESIGLAYRLMDEKWEKKDPAFAPIVFKVIEEEKPKKELPPWLQKIAAVWPKSSPTRTESTEITPDEDSGQNDEDKEVEAKLKRQKFILLVILVVGLILLPASFWYKSVQDEAKEMERKARLNALDSIETKKTTAATSSDETSATASSSEVTVVSDVAEETEATSTPVFSGVPTPPADEVTETVSSSEATSTSETIVGTEEASTTESIEVKPPSQTIRIRTTPSAPTNP